MPQSIKSPANRVHEASLSDSNVQNFESLAKGPAAPITQIAEDTFQSIQDSRLGLGHYAKKYATHSLAFVGGLAAPATALAGLAWHYAPTSNLGILGTGVAATGLLVADSAVNYALGVAPIKSMIKQVGVAIVYGAKKVSEAAISSYTALEQKIDTFQKNRHEFIVSNMTETYNGISNELAKCFEEAKLHPKKMIELKALAKTLEAKLSCALEAMDEIGLSNTEAFQVLAPLKTTIGLVRSFEFKLNMAQDSKAHAYNLNLLLAMPRQNVSSICIPKEVSYGMARAKKQQLGLKHTISKYCDTAVGAGKTFLVAAATTVATAYFANKPAFDAIISGQSILPRVVTLLAATGAGALVGSHIFQKGTQERVTSDAFVAQTNKTAKTQLLKVYNGMASHLIINQPRSSRRKLVDPTLLVNARNLQSKMPEIHRQMNELGIPGLDPKKVTAKLEEALKNILNKY